MIEHGSFFFRLGDLVHMLGALTAQGVLLVAQ